MPRFEIPKARTRRKPPGFEALESRELLTRLPLPAIPSGAEIVNLPAVAYAINALDANTTVTEPTATPPDSVTIPTPSPSVQELHREFFDFKGSANYTVTAPRFVSTQTGTAGQLETIHASGILGSSNQFLVGRPQLIISPSTDPNQAATGIINILASNYLQSGASIILDLTEAAYDSNGNLAATDSGSPTGLSSTGELLPGYHFERTADGLPESFTWTLDPNSGSIYTGSKGATPNPAYAAIVNPIYAAAAASGTTPMLPANLPPQTIPGPTGSGTGAGLFNLSYLPSAHPAAGSTASGQVRITAMGLTNLSGVNNTAAQNFS
jgi:hypothetical protein